MKYKYTYFFAFVISALIAFVAKDILAVSAMFKVMSVISIYLGVCLSFYFIMITMLGSIASMRRSKVFGVTLLKSLFWMIVVAVIVLVSSYIFASYILPHLSFFNFSEMVDTIGLSIEHSPEGTEIPLLSGIAGKVVHLIYQNPTYVNSLIDLDLNSISSVFSLGNFSLFLIFISLFVGIIVSYIIGYFCKPDITVIHPVYTVSNSLTEVGYRFGNAVMKLMNVLIVFVAGYWFQYVITSPYLKDATYFILALVAIILFFVIILLPCLFVVFSKRNPFPIMFSSIVVGLNSLFSCNVVFTSIMSEVIARQEDNIPRKYVSSVYPIFLVLSRVGMASIAYMLTLLIVKNSSLSLTLLQYILLPLICLGLSVICGCSFGSELILILAGAIAYLVNSVGYSVISYSTIVTLLALMPILCGLGSFLDSAIMYYGACAMSDQKIDIIKNLD